LNIARRAVLWLAALATMPSAMALEPGSVSGDFRIDEQVIEFRHVYAQREARGLDGDNDPTWILLFSPVALPLRKVDDLGLDPSLRIGLTSTTTFDDTPTLRVLSQSIFHAGRSFSGGTLPQLELDESGPDRFAGRLFLPEPVTFLGITIHYDIRFSVAVMKRDARRW
jgi:hypothetical protein